MTRNISGKNMVWHKKKDIFIIFSWQGTGLRGSDAQLKADVINSRESDFPRRSSYNAVQASKT